MQSRNECLLWGRSILLLAAVGVAFNPLLCPSSPCNCVVFRTIGYIHVPSSSRTRAGRPLFVQEARKPLLLLNAVGQRMWNTFFFDDLEGPQGQEEDESRWLRFFIQRIPRVCRLVISDVCFFFLGRRIKFSGPSGSMSCQNIYMSSSRVPSSVLNSMSSYSVLSPLA